MSDPLNTHSYDGKLRFDALCEFKDYDLEEKRIKCYEIKEIAEKTFDRKALYYLNGIIASLGKEDNIDKSNMLKADDLLCLCWIYRHNKDFMKELEVQLLDMETGFCPQGRTHRLYQLLIAFELI